MHAPAIRGHSEVIRGHFDNGLWKVSPNIQYLLELFVISSNNQIMYKLLFILFIIKLYARINIFIILFL